MQPRSPDHRILRWAVLFTVLLIGCLAGAVFALNHSRVHDLLIQQLETQFGIEVRTLRVRLFPKASVELSDLLVRDAFTSEPSLRAPKASLSIRLWPFITQRVGMLTLDAVEPQVVIRRDREGNWHVPLVDEDTMDAPRDSSPSTWMLTDVELRQGRLRIVDTTRLEGEGIVVHHLDALLQSNPTHTRAKVLIRGTTDDGGDLHVAGTWTLKESDPSIASGKHFEGTVRFQNWDLAYWLARTGQTSSIPTVTPAGRSTFSAGLRVEFPAHAQGFNVLFSEMRADIGWVQIHGQILVNDAGTEHPVYAIALSTSSFGANTLVAQTPSSWMSPQIQAVVRKHHVAGTVQLESVLLRGRLDVLRAPDEWRVVAKLVDGSGTWSERAAVIRSVSATITVDPKRVDIIRLAGDVNGVHVTSAKTSIAEIDLIPTMEANLNIDGQMEQVLALIEKFTEGTEAHTAVRRVSHAAGDVRAAVYLAGPIAPKRSLRLISADMSLRDMAARVDGTLSIDEVNATLSVDSRGLGLKQVKGVVQGIRFQAQGNIDIESPRVNSLKVDLWSDGIAMQELLTPYLPATSQLRLNGPVEATVLLSGTPTAVQCQGTIDVTHAEVSLPSLLHKRKGVPGLVEWDGKLLDGKRLMLDRSRVALSNDEIHAAGRVELASTPKFHLHINTGPLSFQTLADSGVNSPLCEGTLQTTVSISGEGTDWKLWSPSGSATLHGGVISLPSLNQELSGLSGRLRFTPQGVVLDGISFTSRDGDVRLTGMVEDWRGHPRGRFMVESSDLNVSSLLARNSSSGDTGGSHFQDWIQSKEAVITFLVKQLHYERLLLKTVSGEVTINQHSIKLSELRGKTPKGILTGRLEARFVGTHQIDVAADLYADGIPAQQVLPATQDIEHLQGDVSVDGVLRARIGPNSSLKNTLSTGGDGIRVKIKSGSVHQDPVLTRALKIVNLPAVLFGDVDFDRDGIPFDVLSARVTAQDGVFSSDDIILDSPVIKVAGAGSADVADNGLDLAVAVSPVASYSDLFAKVPLLGPLFVGDHSGLTTAVFQAKGPLQSPDVAYLPLTSIARGLTGYPRLALDVLSHAIKLPPTALAQLAE